MLTAGSLTPVRRSIVAALTGLRAVGASTTVGNAAAPPRATLPRLAVPALPGFCNVRSFRMDEHTQHPERAAFPAISLLLRRSLGEQRRVPAALRDETRSR